jgi:hypothetical protein
MGQGRQGVGRQGRMNPYRKLGQALDRPADALRTARLCISVRPTSFRRGGSRCDLDPLD